MCKQTAYKLVGYRDGRFLSLFDGETEYRIGKLMRQKARSNHGGGFYFYQTVDEAKGLKNSQLASNFDQVALIEVEVSGTIVEYASGKRAATYLRPIRVIEILS